MATRPRKISSPARSAAAAASASRATAARRRTPARPTPAAAADRRLAAEARAVGRDPRGEVRARLARLGGGDAGGAFEARGGDRDSDGDGHAIALGDGAVTEECVLVTLEEAGVVFSG